MVLQIPEAKRLVSILEEYLDQREVALPEGYLSFKVICPNPNFRYASLVFLWEIEVLGSFVFFVLVVSSLSVSISLYYSVTSLLLTFDIFKKTFDIFSLESYKVERTLHYSRQNYNFL